MSESSDNTFAGMGTNAQPREMSMQELSAINAMLPRLFLDGFRGIRLVVDNHLDGYRYYVAVSPKLFEELKTQGHI